MNAVEYKSLGFLFLIPGHQTTLLFSLWISIPGGALSAERIGLALFFKGEEAAPHLA